MGTFTTLSIVDGHSVTRTFAPQRITGDGVAIYNSDESVIAARSTLSQQLKEVPKNNVNRVSIRLSVPRVVSGTDPVTGLPIVNVLPNPDLAAVSFSVSRKGETAQRTDIRVLLANYLLSAAAADAIDNGNATR